MQTRSCLLCGSRNTYAVSSRAKVKCDAEGRILRDAEGNALEIMCRKCRTCGKYYFEDDMPRPESLPKEMQTVLRQVLENREKKEGV